MLTTSVDSDEASVTDVVWHYKMRLNVERRFRVMKDFLAPRPVHHRTEERVRGHIALCVIAAVVEAAMDNDLERAGVRDPDIEQQTISPRRALAELSNLRLHKLNADRRIKLVDRPTKLQHQLLDAFDIEANAWSRARIS